jgi:hypothetical protein
MVAAAKISIILCLSVKFSLFTHILPTSVVNQYTKSCFYYGAKTMTMMTIAEVASFLSVQDIRVQRLERESLLLSKDKDADGNPLFDKNDVEKYKELAQRLGGL